MDRVETNFRLALMAIDEVRIATENVAKTVDENHKTVTAALTEQVSAVNSLASTMATAFDGFRIFATTQDALIARVSQLEAAVAELQKKAS